ncbi:hypothetical protein T261_2364 [Streptomyces lydicus]|nr:hypothetical protein T261_2364 [Streptomyces lydicus]
MGGEKDELPNPNAAMRITELWGAPTRAMDREQEAERIAIGPAVPGPVAL